MILKTRGTIVTYRCSEKITVKQRIVGTSIPAHEVSLSLPVACIVRLHGSCKSFACIILTFVGRWIHRLAPLVSPIFHVAIFVTSHDVEVVSLVEILGVLSIGSSYNVILLLLIFAVATIVESVCRLWIVGVVLSTSAIFSSYVGVKMKVFETMYLIVCLYITQENMRTLVEIVVFNFFYRVCWSIVVAVIWECRVI